MNYEEESIITSYANESLFYVDPSDADSKQMKEVMNYYYNSSYASNAAFWQQAFIDKRFKVGDNSVNPVLYGASIDKSAGKFVFNLIARHINMIVGRQRQNRKSTVALPRFDNDDLADDYNRVLKWCENLDGFQEYLSQAFENACDTGISLLHLYPSYNSDPVSGDLYTEQVSYNNFLIDPYFRKQDLSDCQFVWRRKWVSKEAAKTLLPGMKSEIDKIRSNGLKDGKFPLQAELMNADLSKLFTYDEFYYTSFRDAIVIEDPMSQESSQWFGTDEELEGILIQQPWLKQKKTQIPTVKLSISLAGKVVYNGPNLLNIDSYPFVPVLAYHEPDMQSYSWRIRGVVRNMRDAQFLYNKRKTIELQILQSQINSGWIYPVDVLTDPKALRQTGEGFLVPLKSGRTPQEIQRIDPPGLPPSLMELSKSLSDDITKISGVNEELLGAADDDKSGILSMLRQGAGLTTLQTLFDKLDYSQRIYGKIRVEAIIKNFSEGKVKSIIRKDVAPNFFSSLALNYGIAVEEGNYSATQRQIELQQLLHFKQLGIEIPNSSILNAAIITNKKEIIEQMQQQEQQVQQQQQEQARQQQELMNLDSNAKVVDAYSKSKLDLAKEEETKANIERIYTQSTLDMVKAMSELKDADFDRVQKAFDVANAIRQETKEDMEDEKNENIDATE